MVYYESEAHSKFCELAYGADLKQMGMSDMYELDILLELSAIKPNASVIDFGCGAGYISVYIAKKTCSLLTGVDIDRYAINHAWAAHKETKNVSFYCDDMYNIAFSKQYTNHIISIDSLYFITHSRVESFMSYCLSMLDTNGIISILINTYKEGNTKGVDACINWLNQHNLHSQIIDLTDNASRFWVRC